MTNEELAELGEPEAVRYGFDGYGYMYLDNGSGSDWLTRIPDAEPLYPVTALQPLIATAREAEALRAENARLQARADAARREALEEAAKVADGYAAAGKDNPQLAPISAQMRYCAQRIRALKENPNAG